MKILSEAVSSQVRFRNGNGPFWEWLAFFNCYFVYPYVLIIGRKINQNSPAHQKYSVVSGRFALSVCHSGLMHTLWGIRDQGSVTGAVIHYILTIDSPNSFFQYGSHSAEDIDDAAAPNYHMNAVKFL